METKARAICFDEKYTAALFLLLNNPQLADNLTWAVACQDVGNSKQNKRIACHPANKKAA